MSRYLCAAADSERSDEIDGGVLLLPVLLGIGSELQQQRVNVRRGNLGDLNFEFLYLPKLSSELRECHMQCEYAICMCCLRVHVRVRIIFEAHKRGETN